MIHVQQPNIAIPAFVASEVSKLQAYKTHPDDPVDVRTIYALGRWWEFIICYDGRAQWHTDRHIPERFSSLYVVRNDVESYVQLRGVEPVKPQPAGTLVFLDTHRSHRLWNDSRSKVGVWAAVGIMYDTRCAVEDAVQDMRNQFSISEGIKA